MICFRFLIAVSVLALPLVGARQFCVNNERGETWTVFAFAPDNQFCQQQELGGGQQHCFDLPSVIKGGVIWAKQQSRDCGGPGKSPLAEFSCENDNVCWIGVDYENGRQYEIDICPPSGNGGASVGHDYLCQSAQRQLHSGGVRLRLSLSLRGPHVPKTPRGMQWLRVPLHRRLIHR